MRRHRQEAAADQSGPEGVRDGGRRAEVQHLQLPRRPGACQDRRPAAVDGTLEEEERDQAARDVEGHLQGVHPDHRLDAAEVGVHQGGGADDQDRHRVRPARDDREGDRGREQADRIGQQARDHEDPGRVAPRTAAESGLEEGVGGRQLAAVVGGDEDPGHHRAPRQVAERQLQEGEGAEVGDPGDGKEGERAGLGRDHREHDRPPGEVAAAEEVVGPALVGAPEPCTPRGYAQHIEQHYRRVNDTEGHRGPPGASSRSDAGVSVIARATRSCTPRRSGTCPLFSRVGFTRLVRRTTPSSRVGSIQIEVPV